MQAGGQHKGQNIVPRISLTLSVWNFKFIVMQMVPKALNVTQIIKHKSTKPKQVRSNFIWSSTSDHQTHRLVKVDIYAKFEETPLEQTWHITIIVHITPRSLVRFNNQCLSHFFHVNMFWKPVSQQLGPLLSLRPITCQLLYQHSIWFHSHKYNPAGMPWQLYTSQVISHRRYKERQNLHLST